MADLFRDGFEEVERDGAIELAAYGDRADEGRVREAFGAADGEDVPPGWAEAWKRFHRPVHVGPLWVGPPWLVPDASPTAVIIEPGRAFGTGAHATTRLCLELLLERPRTSVVDVGCGSGVIAIAAAKVGFSPVHALDSDEAAVEAARSNARVNGVDVAVALADVLRDPLPDARLAVANIARAPLERLAARLRSDTLIASGYLSSERLRLPGWRCLTRRERDGWAAELFARP